jgi:hypothetical protein
MRRALAMLKYLPAMLCGLLVVAWVVSFACEVTVRFPTAKGDGSVGIENACFTIRHTQHEEVWIGILLTTEKQGWTLKTQSPTRLTRLRDVWGSFQFDQNASYVRLQMPIPGLIVLALPLALGPFTRFRFPLWSYFAWTTLVAAGLAYYLRA